MAARADRDGRRSDGRYIEETPREREEFCWDELPAEDVGATDASFATRRGRKNTGSFPTEARSRWAAARPGHGWSHRLIDAESKSSLAECDPNTFWPLSRTLTADLRSVLLPTNSDNECEWPGWERILLFLACLPSSPPDYVSLRPIPSTSALDSIDTPAKQTSILGSLIHAQSTVSGHREKARRTPAILHYVLPTAEQLSEWPAHAPNAHRRPQLSGNPKVIVHQPLPTSFLDGSHAHSAFGEKSPKYLSPTVKALANTA
ncbi:hypothetical protein C8F01DRAFT_1086385 [Mycena amicta]|nr:hypothetical protein C8F01DRAFT_1086385 [Mycena amicta]